MTELEAQSKWCPFSRADNRPDNGINCLASGCAAWRLDQQKQAGKHKTVPTGHCGLAGPRERM